MKKIFTFIILTGILVSLGYAQPTASITIENPRIDGNRLYWDVYFMRTNDDANWNNFGNHMLGDCSWYWYFNLTDLTNYAINEEDPTIFGTSYTNTIGVINGNLRINTVFSPVDPTDIALNVWYKAFTCSAEITGDDTQLSGLTWDMINTGITTFNNQSVTETDYDSDCDIALNTNCWTGFVNGDWNNVSNWSLGSIPIASDDVIYPYDANIEMTTNNGAYGITNGLRVNHNARLLIAFNEGITVTGDVELKGDTNIHLAGQTGLGTLSSFLIAEGNIDYNGYSLESGHVRVDRTLYYEDTEFDYYHHQVASPVNYVRLGDWDMQHQYSYAYEFAADQSWFNIHSPFRSTPPGYGFILSLYGASGFETSTQTVIFYDSLVTTPVNPPLTTGNGNLSLIGNPYTAPIHWDVIYSGASQMADAVWVWNPDGGNYEAYNTVGGGTSASAEFIQPGQAFFVQATGVAPTCQITPSARTTDIHPYLKSSSANGLTLYTEGGNSSHDKTCIKFIDSEMATGNYEESIDVLEWPSSYGDMATELYTVSSDDQNLIIDVRPLSPDLMSVPLSFKAAVEAEYTLGADLESLESFSVGTEIFLEDLHHPEQAWIDLREFNTYSFDATPEDEYNRFMIHFHIKDFGINELSESPIYIYSDRTDAIIKNNSGQLIKEIHIFDVTGNLMTVKSGVNDDITRMFVSSNSGYYVVKVITDKAVYSEKVLITK